MAQSCSVLGTLFFPSAMEPVPHLFIDTPRQNTEVPLHMSSEAISSSIYSGSTYFYKHRIKVVLLAGTWEPLAWPSFLLKPWEQMVWPSLAVPQ